MPLNKLKKFFAGPAPRLSREDVMKVFTRDRFRCQYCGLDGLSTFGNWMLLTVDHVRPRAHGGARGMENLVTCCQPCNVIKGKRLYRSFDEARGYVLAQREEYRQAFQEASRAAASRAEATGTHGPGEPPDD